MNYAQSFYWVNLLIALHCIEVCLSWVIKIEHIPAFVGILLLLKTNWIEWFESWTLWLMVALYSLKDFFKIPLIGKFIQELIFECDAYPFQRQAMSIKLFTCAMSKSIKFWPSIIMNCVTWTAHTHLNLPYKWWLSVHDVHVGKFKIAHNKSLHMQSNKLIYIGILL